MSIKDRYRVGRRVGQARWQIKQAPTWRVVHQCDTLRHARFWLVDRGVAPENVSVLIAGGDWPSLDEAMERGIA